MTTEHYERPYIHTQAGRFYIDAPEWDVDAIGHSLGMLCRFNGHTERFYSVAEHSILVARLMRAFTDGDPLEGLLHDATESILSDIPTPFKRLLPDWGKFEEELERDLRQSFELPLEKTEACNYADKLALFIEAAQLIPEGGTDFVDPLNVKLAGRHLATLAQWKLDCYSPEDAGAIWAGVVSRRLGELDALANVARN